VEDFGELPERDQRQFEGHRAFRPFEAHPNSSLARRQQNGGVHAKAADFAGYFYRQGGVAQWQNSLFRVSWHGISLGAGDILRRPHEWLRWEVKVKSSPARIANLLAAVQALV
jgi:hypothetical protein